MDELYITKKKHKTYNKNILKANTKQCTIPCSVNQEGGDQGDREREAPEVQEAGGGERGETTH